MPTSLHDTAASIHGDHLARAARALERGDFRLFWLHSRLCDTVANTLTELQGLPASGDKTESSTPMKVDTTKKPK